MTDVWGLCSDIHAHNWTAFATLDGFGRNSRLMEIIREIDRCCAAVAAEGGDLVVFGGDIFHHRGSVTPSVYNPLRDLLREWRRKGMRFEGIPGNHDCEGKTAARLTSAAAMLEEEGGIEFWHVPAPSQGQRLYIPYVGGAQATIAAIETAIDLFGGSRMSEMDLVIHCGIDGTLTHMPAHGFTAEKLASYGFKRVFAGDYHHHLPFEGGVYSIGATTQQTWSDLGTKAGFCLVYPDRVEFRASHAPSFVEITGEEDETDIALKVDGHYVRARIGAATSAEVAHWRELLTEMGAKGVVIQAIPADAGSRRAGVSAKSLASLDQSVLDYVSERGLGPEVAQSCARILQEVRA